MEPIDFAREMTHFFTVTLKPNLYELTARQQIKKTFKKLSEVLKPLAMKYLLVAELTKQCNIHYHGIIQWDTTTMDKDTMSMIFLDNLKPLVNYGRSESQLIEDTEHVYKYIVKDIIKTGNVVNPKGKTPFPVYECYKKPLNGLLNNIFKPNKAVSVKSLVSLNKDINFDSEDEIISAGLCPVARVGRSKGTSAGLKAR